MPVARLLRFLLVLVLVLAAVPAGFDYYGGRRLESARARFAQQIGEPDYAALATATPETADNAATWLERGMQALPADGDSEDLARLAALRPAAWTAADSRLAESALAPNRDALDLLRRAAYRRGRFEFDFSQGARTPLPDYLTLLRASKLLQVDARGALVRGDRVTALLDLETLSAAIDTLSADPILVSKIIALALDRQYLDLARDMLAAEPGDAHLLDSLEGHFEDRDLAASLRLGLHGEGAFIASIPIAATSHPGRLAALVLSPLDDLFKADSLDDYSDLAERLDRPWPELSTLFGSMRDSPRFWNLRVRLVANLEDTARRLKALESAYSLARAASHYARTGEVEALGDDPFSGEPYDIAPLAGGGMSFSSPSAEALWQRTEKSPRYSHDPPYAWPVPATR